MNEGVVEQPVPEQAQSVGEQAETPQGAPPLTVTEHAQLHSDRKDALPAEEKTALEAKAAHHTEQQKRDREGKFAEGKVRHRAKSQQASPEDVPRIRELTAKLRTAEAEVQRLKAQHAPAAQIAQAERTVERVEAQRPAPVKAPPDPTDPEPQEGDQKYAGDYGQYLRDVTRWEARQERRQWEAEQTHARAQQRRQAAEQATIKSFGDRVQAAKQKYDDFEAVAFGPSPIPAGSPTDAFIMEDDNGADVLYHLHGHPDELTELLRMPVLQQLKRLALLSQRFETPSEPAERTGAAAGHLKVVLPPRPPTPVRTEAQRVSGPPPTDGSLSVAEHAKKFRRS